MFIYTDDVLNISLLLKLFLSLYSWYFVQNLLAILRHPLSLDPLPKLPMPGSGAQYQHSPTRQGALF
jgi:hypothetical protein